jgi:hypothetical protein
LNACNHTCWQKTARHPNYSMYLLPDTFRQKVYTRLDLTQVTRVLRAMSGDHQRLVVGIAGNCIGLRCGTEKEHEDWLACWATLTGE